ncbi:general substrate transporter [Exophiala viscosa]|uniref:general substrate transporter n=1 Tax=Exophiala viscosa TaxID=2486360 RepID=UPI002195B28A|nr:general substrate transporter [Exophiala viscosa]
MRGPLQYEEGTDPPESHISLSACSRQPSDSCVTAKLQPNMISLVQFGIVLFVGLGSMTYGYGSSIIATTTGQPTFLSYFELDTKPNAAALLGAINGLFSAGGLFGCISCLYIPDKWGRKKSLSFAAICAIIGSGLAAGSVHIAMFMVARLITGFSVGALVSLVPLYQSEISPPRIRGLLVGMHGTGIATGYCAASWIGFGFYFVNAKSTQWRMPLAIGALWPLLLGVGVMLIPESPRWLLTKDQPDQALKAFKACRTESGPQNDEHAILEEFHLLHMQVLEEMKEFVPLKAFFTRPALRKRCFIGWLTMAAGQMTGTIVINNYGPFLYKKLGFSVTNQLLIQCGWISVCWLGNAFNAAVIDRIGRVRLLIFGLIGDVIALAGECATVAQYTKTGSPACAKAAVFFLFLHIGFYGWTIDASTYIYASEIFPNPLRARGIGISIAGLFMMVIIFTSAAPTAFDKIGWKYYLVFCLLTAMNAVIVWFTFPETKGKALEDIAEIFGDGIVLSDAREEEIHRRFKESGYQAQVLDEVHHEVVLQDDMHHGEKMVVTHAERTENLA